MKVEHHKYMHVRMYVRMYMHTLSYIRMDTLALCCTVHTVHIRTYKYIRTVCGVYVHSEVQKYEDSANTILEESTGQSDVP